jgi:hypothetical protein
MIEIPLTQGKVALIDDEDWILISRFDWFAHEEKSLWYAHSSVKRRDGARTTIKMHRLILGARAGQRVDHRDGNGLNNQRDNLRLATQMQNTQNQRRKSNNTSGYKGVCRWKTSRWQAYITVHKKRIPLGLFNNKEDAARAYDNAARQHFGEFAKLNFPLE